MGGANPRLLAGVDALLGPRDEAHPTGTELVALAGGALDGRRAGELERHLESCASCAGLLAAARAGLAELRRLEADPSPAGRHLPLPIPVPARARALAAGGAEEPAPAPADRRVLLDDGDGPRLVYFRQGGRGQLGVFGVSAGEVRVVLDGATLAAAEAEQEAVIYALGPVGRLPGATLEVEARGRRSSFTLVEDEAEEDPRG